MMVGGDMHGTDLFATAYYFNGIHVDSVIVHPDPYQLHTGVQEHMVGIVIIGITDYDDVLLCKKRTYDQVKAHRASPRDHNILIRRLKSPAGIQIIRKDLPESFHAGSFHIRGISQVHLLRQNAPVGLTQFVNGHHPGIGSVMEAWNVAKRRRRHLDQTIAADRIPRFGRETVRFLLVARQLAWVDFRYFPAGKSAL